MKQPKEPNESGRPRIERPPKIPQKRGRKPKVRTEEPQEKKRPKEHPKFIQLDVSDILKMLKILKRNCNGKPKSRITI